MSTSRAQLRHSNKRQQTRRTRKTHRLILRSHNSLVRQWFDLQHIQLLLQVPRAHLWLRRGASGVLRPCAKTGGAAGTSYATPWLGRYEFQYVGDGQRGNPGEKVLARRGRSSSWAGLYGAVPTDCAVLSSIDHSNPIVRPLPCARVAMKAFLWVGFRDAGQTVHQHRPAVGASLAVSRQSCRNPLSIVKHGRTTQGHRGVT